MRRILSALLTCFVTGIALPAHAIEACGTADLIADLPDSDKAILAERVAEVPFAEGTMFRATKGDSTVTVVGTLHLPDPRLGPMLDALTPAIQSADLLILELTSEDEAQMQRMAAEKPEQFFLTEGPTLIDLLSEEDWALAQEQLAARGIPAFLAAKYQPWFLSLTLGLPPCVVQAVASGEKGLDRQIEAIAMAAGVDRAALDPPDILFQVFGSVPLDEQLESLQYSLHSDLNGDEMISTLLSAYFDGRMAESWEFNRLLAEDLEGGRFMEQMAEFEEALLINRNQLWEPLIKNMSDGKDVVVAVGALHLPGETGVLRSLERAGYVVEPF